MALDLEIRAKKAMKENATSAFAIPAASTKPIVQETFAATRKTYRIRSVPRGFVYVFNNQFIGQEDERLGAELDSENLKEIFTQLGYAVFLKENFRAQQIKDELDSIREDRRLNHVDALIIFFLSHGNSPYSFRGNDNKDLDLRSLRRKFADSKCPQMKGKPKVFFANYCRGDRFQKRIEFDSAHEYDDGSLEAPRDMVTIQAAIEGVKVPRSKGLGTFFIKCLCDVLRHHGRSKSLKDVYHELDVRTQEIGGTQPMWEEYIFHEFFF
ncbi:caspase-2-like [Penaeus chinensis]|uniref:caspase-2-like n=1 Tax=Penaeus chinensis TaxID=139456 RepID=UPI001FB6F22E|nr:caspase-2-like [Penaeus chinensis]